METVIEQQRRYHEERERLEDAMTHELVMKKNSLKEQINSDHRVSLLLDRYTQVTEKLEKLYSDEDSLLKEEIALISGPNEFAEFYGRLRMIKHYHRKYPNEVSEPMQIEFMKLKEAREKPVDEQEIMVEFTDEEGFGKYLDLHEAYTQFINLKNIEHIDYLTYLMTFDRLFEISKDKKNHDFENYLNTLIDYLYHFLQRAKPLLNLEKELKEALDDFNSKFDAGSFIGWPKEAGSALTHAGALLDLSLFSSPEELSSLGLDRLKSALQALNLKCGGTLEERARRLFSTKGLSLENLESSAFAKVRSKGKGADNAKKQKEIASLEAQVYRLVELVSEERQATRENVERKQARTSDELDEEEEDHTNAEESGDEEEQVLYNPKNLPLGWDGKPIPYWLYKLHGLNLYYKCEICGNQQYRGPKAFQRHFSEWRHAHGMRVLNIPNTAHFANVTKIEDALSLWDKLKEVKAKERFQADVEEEFEDSVGNVVNKKTYEDLSRQGLL
uniref:Splicing factor 3A subunit 3 n=1 Tax=Hydra vulgaris TaxID=6087 RepID=T2MDR3_HYDVU